MHAYHVFQKLDKKICPRVWLSTRSGAWVVPNYLFGHPVDHYACRAFLWLPWKLGTFILETVIKLLHGNPSMYGLNPKMHALQTQPSVSPVLYHHIQRGQIKIVPNIQKIEGKTVHFTDGQSAEFDQIVLCTGYRIDLPYLADDVRSKVLDEGTNHIKLYKNVFSPEVGHTLAFIGFVQPASGGVLTMSEIQSRWFAELCKGKVKLPSKQAMEKSIEKDKRQHADRYFASARHTIQKDPILYNDDIAAKFGAKPQLWRHPTLAWRLLLSSCGASQWRLQGPNKWDKAAEEIRKVPVTGLIQNMAVLLLALFASLLLLLFIFAF
ncbi:dimethylaniline monooxygenase [N-oxide-forming] 5-like [Lingula anatina]|uniref:Flavin-containing monooxygenase n=1 Tax=Lingula anatina TaxID=7574 RepID=A0A1S3JV39_LINAN|nr:dimethylaniline monooxygenase [N-oxide-forming] 5-like [Lingula anatina]|eukprot:XP_013414250.1 dimethylaniline monooxygenase [N-oxide-forming] 5-like [Lingula anatina]